MNVRQRPVADDLGMHYGDGDAIAIAIQSVDAELIVVVARLIALGSAFDKEGRGRVTSRRACGAMELLRSVFEGFSAQRL